jgi:hypothetical protein
LSAVAADVSSRKTRPPADRVVNRYLAHAYENARLALELAPAEQHKTILDDPALQPIRKSLRFLESKKTGP